MTENQWTKTICEMLSGDDLGENIQITTFQKLPYAFEIQSFEENWSIDCFEKTPFETDMLIYEKKNGKFIPRVIVESKVGAISTHDVITYSQKASYHKNVIPFVRYGIMCGDRKQYPLPGRLFRHGTNFDFLFSFVGLEPTAKEKNVFIDMLRKEILYSQQFEEIISNSRSRGRKRYFMLQKEFHLQEMEENE